MVILICAELYALNINDLNLYLNFLLQLILLFKIYNFIIYIYLRYLRYFF